MFKSLIPDLRLGSVYEITPELLKKMNIGLLMLDLDNTLAPYKGAQPSAELLRWKDAVISSGTEMIIVSNTKTERAKNFASDLGIKYVDHARKPFADTIESVITRMGKEGTVAALAGDQIFTDVWGANRADAFSIIVRPIELNNVFYLLRYSFELIFRAFAKKTV